MDKKEKTTEGMIIKGYSGFYYVWDGETIWECSLRGRFRLGNQRFLPGDRVVISLLDVAAKKAVLEEVLNRKTELQRPPIANVEQAVLVVSLKDPQPDLRLLDRLLIITQYQGIKPVICFNKIDLLKEREIYTAPYEKARFPILYTSCKSKQGIEELREAMKKRVSVFAGPSGVGKSSLLNALEGLVLKTSPTSARLARGKHTTRHVELIMLSGGGFLADTPGFSQARLPQDLKREELKSCYPDFQEYGSGCRFKTCLHSEEPQCGVRDAVQKRMLDQDRYSRYLEILAEVIKEERRY